MPDTTQKVDVKTPYPTILVVVPYTGQQLYSYASKLTQQPCLPPEFRSSSAAISVMHQVKAS